MNNNPVDRRTFLQSLAALSTVPLAGLPANNARATTTAKRIDVHNHCIPKPYIDGLLKAGLEEIGGISVRGNSREGIALPKWSPQLALDLMDRNGIQFAFTTISSPGVYFGDTRVARDLARICADYQAQLMSDHPTRFGAFGHIPFPDIDASLKHIEYMLDTLELDGLIMLASIGGIYQGQPEYEEIYAELNRRKGVVFIHPTAHPSSSQIGIGLPMFMVEFLFDTTRCIANLIFKGVLERYPDIRFIFSHAGGTAPFTAWRLDASSKVDPRLKENISHEPSYYLKRIYYDTALSATPWIMATFNELGIPPSQILFGSDWPFAPEPLTVASIENLEAMTVIDDASRELIYRGNALRMFPRLHKAMMS